MDNTQPPTSFEPDQPTTTPPTPEPTVSEPVVTQEPAVPNAPAEPSSPLSLPNETPAESTPSPSVGYLSQPAPFKKPRSKALPIVAVLVVLLIIGGLSFFLLKGKDKKVAPNNNQPAVTDTTKDNEVGPVATILKLEAKAKTLHDAQKANYTYTVEDDNRNGVIYKTDGVDYMVHIPTEEGGSFNHLINAKGTSYEVSSKAQADTLKALGEYITTLGYKKVDTITITQPATDVTYDYYKKDSILCSMPINAGYSSVWADCITTDKIASAAKEVKPFVDLYLKAVAKSQYEYFGVSKVEDGKNNYKITTISTNTAPLKFVKTDAQKEWKYAGVLGFQSPSDCKDYEKDTDIQKAFQGSACIEAGAQREVK